MIAQVCEKLPIFDQPRVEPAAIIRIELDRLCDYVLRLGHDLRIPDRIRTADSPWSVEFNTQSP